MEANTQVELLKVITDNVCQPVAVLLSAGLSISFLLVG